MSARSKRVTERTTPFSFGRVDRLSRQLECFVYERLQDRWNVSYMNAVKNFQDNWVVSCHGPTGLEHP